MSDADPLFADLPPKPQPTSPPRRVVCAAMLMDDGLIVPGVRHLSPDMRAVLRRIYGGRSPLGRWFRKPYWARVKEEGFIDQYGAFLSRGQALVIAIREGQVRRRSGNPNDPELYSEDLY